jgi:hypothetical protein
MFDFFGSDSLNNAFFTESRIVASLKERPITDPARRASLFVAWGRLLCGRGK